MDRKVCTGLLVLCLSILLVKCQDTTTEGLTTTPEPPLTWFECPDQYSYHPHPANCTQYMICVFGKAYLRACEGGLNWNDQLKICDWPNARTTCQQVDENTAYRPAASPVITPPPTDDSSVQNVNDYQTETKGKYRGSQGFNHFKPDENAAKEQLVNFAGKKVVYFDAPKDSDSGEQASNQNSPMDQSGEDMPNGQSNNQGLNAQGSAKQSTGQQLMPFGQLGGRPQNPPGKAQKMSSWDTGNEDFPPQQSSQEDQQPAQMPSQAQRPSQPVMSKNSQGPAARPKAPLNTPATSTGGNPPPWAAAALKRKSPGMNGAPRMPSQSPSSDENSQQSPPQPQSSQQGKYKPSGNLPSGGIPPWASQPQRQIPPPKPSSASTGRNPWDSDGDDAASPNQNVRAVPNQDRSKPQALGSYQPPTRGGAPSKPSQNSGLMPQRGQPVRAQTYQPDTDIDSNSNDQSNVPNPNVSPNRPQPSNVGSMGQRSRPPQPVKISPSRLSGLESAENNGDGWNLGSNAAKQSLARPPANSGTEDSDIPPSFIPSRVPQQQLQRPSHSQNLGSRQVPSARPGSNGNGGPRMVPPSQSSANDDNEDSRPNPWSNSDDSQPPQRPAPGRNAPTGENPWAGARPVSANRQPPSQLSWSDNNDDESGEADNIASMMRAQQAHKGLPGFSQGQRLPMNSRRPASGSAQSQSSDSENDPGQFGARAGLSEEDQLGQSARSIPARIFGGSSNGRRPTQAGSFVGDSNDDAEQPASSNYMEHRIRNFYAGI